MTKTFPFFLLMVVFGFTTLWLSAALFAGAGPWGNPLYVYAALALVATFGYFKPRRFWLWPVGIYVGEMIHLSATKLADPQSEVAAWWQLGAVVITMSLIPLFFACGLGRLCKLFVKKYKERQRV